MKDIMKKIAEVKVNPCYDIPGENVLEIMDKSGSKKAAAVINGFRIGYLQGYKAAKAEIARIKEKKGEV